MKTFYAPGEVPKYTAPTGGVVSGSAYLIGSLLVIATETVAQTLPFPGESEGVVTLPRVNNEVWSEGLKLYWDDTAKKITLDDNTAANPLVGVALDAIAASPTVATGRIRLDGAVR